MPRQLPTPHSCKFCEKFEFVIGKEDDFELGRGHQNRPILESFSSADQLEAYRKASHDNLGTFFAWDSITFGEIKSCTANGCIFFEYIQRSLNHEIQKRQKADSYESIEPLQDMFNDETVLLIGYLHERGLHHMDDFASQISFTVFHKTLGRLQRWKLSWPNKYGGFGNEGQGTYVAGEYYFQLVSSQRDDIGAIPLRINEEPGSDEAFDLARKQLRICQEEHGVRQETKNRRPPTRLLEISGKEEQLYIRLVETQCHNPSPDYVALSYCWGRDQTLTLTQETQATLLAGVSIEDLPGTFHDAVTTANRLGLRFLWIDSLCIFQDDEKDKRMEISKMPSIYGGSTLTISSSRTTSSTERFLATRCVFDDNTRYVFKFRYRTGQMPQAKDAICFSRGNLFYRDATEPLASRGWALQERLLSPRILDYRIHNTLSICQHVNIKDSAYDYVDGWMKIQPRGLWSPGDRQAVDEAILHIRKQILSPRITTDKLSDTFTWSKTELYRLWVKCVKIYAGCNLTVPGDRLPALAAVAHEFAELLDDEEYCAGIWRSSLPGGLLWDVRGFQMKRGCWRSKPRAKGYKGPSWSWVSAPEGEDIINAFTDSCIIEDIKVVEFQAQPAAGSDRFGALEHAVLVLRAKAVEVELWEGDGTNEPPLGKRCLYRRVPSAHLSSPPGQERLAAMTILDCDESQIMTACFGGKGVHAVPIVYIDHMYGGSQRRHIKGLLLCKTYIEGSGDVFSRIGTFYFGGGEQNAIFQQQWAWINSGQKEDFHII